jgi:hypothetical protein
MNYEPGPLGNGPFRHGHRRWWPAVGRVTAIRKEFNAKASDAEMAVIFHAIGIIARETGIEADGLRRQASG